MSESSELHLFKHQTRTTPTPIRFGKSAGYSQRVAVKVIPSSHKKPHSWSAYGRGYLTQEGKGKDGEKGQGFSAEHDNADLKKELGVWQKAKDPQYYQLIIGPDRGADLKLTQYTRRVMEKMETDLNTKLQWVGVEHHDKRPHTHVVIRGRDEAGKPLHIEARYPRELQQFAQNLATRELGYRVASHDLHQRERTLGKESFTETDRGLIAKADRNNVVDLSRETPANVAQEARLNQEQRRLAYLSQLGMAKEIERGKWQLYPELRREMLFRGANREYAPEWRKPKQEMSLDKTREQNQERVRTMVRVISQEKGLGLGRGR